MRFSIGGMLRFLSHAETMRVFQRACARARLPIRHTQGFNPHPRLSLPLPRTVGVASDDELLVIRLFDERGIPRGASCASAGTTYENEMTDRLAQTLPKDIVTGSTQLMDRRASFLPVSARYRFPLRPWDPVGAGDRLREKMAQTLAAESLIVERRSPGRRRDRRLDVRGFLRSMLLEGTDLTVDCGINAAGSIRIDEIMHLLELRTEDLAGPIRRMNVTWNITQPLTPEASEPVG